MKTYLNSFNQPVKSFIITTIFFCLLLVSQSCDSDKTGFSTVSLKCEYIINPLGIDEIHPRFTWQMADDRQGAEQTAYELFLGTDSSEVAKGQGNVWTSGKIRSNLNLVKYTGDSLKPFTRYYWSARLWDQNHKPSSNTPVAFFETGMIDSRNWKGSWISDSPDINLKPAPYFRKSFNVSGKVTSARQYIAVAGLYELYINGTKVGNHSLDPAYTRFDRRTFYLTHDVTSLIHEGENTIGVILGNGWYNHQSTAVWYFDKAPWRSRPKFCTDLLLTYDDGSVETITSGTDWKTSLSPVVFNSIYTGEHYDARLNQPGWNTEGFDDSKWKKAIPVSSPSKNIVSQVMQPIRITEKLSAKSITHLNNNTWLFDLGRNIAGISSLKVSGETGTVIRMKHAERLNNKGWADQSNIDVHYRPTDESDPFQTDIFTLSGNGEEYFMPRFNYKGFQYIEVSSDKPVTLTKESLTGFFMHSDVPVAGKIESSDTLLNEIWKATNNSYLSNLYGYPTDCPQREKNGWTGDAHIAVETGLYNFDGITVYEKWLNDHLDEQQPNGVLPAIIPSSGWGYTWANGPDWTSTIAIIPWNIYLFYGDSQLLGKCYEGIKRYVDHITEISPSGLTDWGLGDWIPIKSVAPKELTSSVYYFVDVTILAKTAALFGKKADFEKYSALGEKIKAAINNKYLNKELAVYGNGLQTELCVPLQWGLVPEDIKSRVADNLARSVEAGNNHMDVGLLGTKAILNALSENGYSDLSYTLATQATFPSWGWWIVNGATTLYENWPLDTNSDISMNHIMFGEVGAWMYKALGGIKPDEANPGFRNVILKPNFVKGLDHFEAKHDGPFGTILSSWKKEGEKVIYNVIIPPNSTATLNLKGSSILENNKELSENKHIKTVKNIDGSFTIYLKSGTYLFSVSK
jgi:alpha-L-rhamnosidase